MAVLNPAYQKPANPPANPLEKRLNSEEAAFITKGRYAKFSSDPFLLCLANLFNISISYDEYYQVKNVKIEKISNTHVDVLVYIESLGEKPFHYSWFSTCRKDEPITTR